MITFDGKKESAFRLEQLRQRIATLFLEQPLKIFSLVFEEDEPSKIYTRLKKQDAAKIGVEYEDIYVPLLTPINDLLAYIQKANTDPKVNGIIIQKPAKLLMPSAEWWDQLRATIEPKKDVDGLHPQSGVMPATARAIMEILHFAQTTLEISPIDKKVVVLGRSDIVGKPVAQALMRQGMQVELFGRQEFAQGERELEEADIVIAATGQQNLVTSEMLKQGVIAIDAGSPKPEISPIGIEGKAAFLSPVPGGVGPMTRVCLLENLFDLVQSQK